jgi:hypothetical protein
MTEEQVEAMPERSPARGRNRPSKLAVASMVAAICATVLGWPGLISFPAHPVAETLVTGLLLLVIALVAVALGIGSLSKRRRERLWRKWLEWLAIILAASAIRGMFLVLPLLILPPYRAYWETCVDNAVTLGGALNDYRAAHDNRLPDAKRWCDELRPYVPDRSVFECYLGPRPRSAFAFNARLSGLKYESLEYPAGTVVITMAIYESEREWETAGRGWNAVGGPESLPREKPGVLLVVTADGEIYADRPADLASDMIWKPRSRAPAVPSNEAR